MILTERNVNEENQFWTIHLDYSIIGIVFTLLMIGILSVYVAVSHDYPQMVWPFGAAIILDWCGMYHLPDCDDF